MAEPGILFAVVGPSGAGKDTLLDEVRQMLNADPRFVFQQRTITRPAAAGGEAHRAVSPETFVAEEVRGDFALSWRAHELAYGLPMAMVGALATGTHVIANMSRAVVAEAVARFSPVCVIHITAPDDVLRARLAARGRESSADQAARVVRAAEIPADAAVIEIVNDGPVAVGAERLLAAFRMTANRAP